MSNAVEWYGELYVMADMYGIGAGIDSETVIGQSCGFISTSGLE